MDARSREHEVERAWRQHQPERAHVRSTTWREVRAFKRSLAPGAATALAHSEDTERLRPLLRACWRKGTLARDKQRALQNLQAFLHPATLDQQHGVFLWSWLVPCGATLANPQHPGETQDAILTRYGIAWSKGRHELIGYTAFAVECPDHALGRLLERAPGINLAQALSQAHHAFLTADAEQVSHHVLRSTLYLQCGPGLLICDAVRAKAAHRVFVFARARTWIADDMARRDQKPIAAARHPIPSQLTVMTALALRGVQ
jgi:hypothetical protein